MDNTKTFALCLLVLKQKTVKAFHRSATSQKTRKFCAQTAHDKYYRQDRRDWNINSLP